jgi:hypothetical protein
VKDGWLQYLGYQSARRVKGVLLEILQQYLGYQSRVKGVLLEILQQYLGYQSRVKGVPAFR